MKNLFIVLSICYCLAITFSKPVPFRIVYVANDTGAACLDGSPAAYYVSEYSKKEDEKKFILSFEGGGWCGSSQSVNATIADCYGRSKTALGSSTSYPKTVDDMGGILSGDPTVNPYFYSWNRIFIKYCDGTGH